MILEWLSFWYEFHCKMNNRQAQLIMQTIQKNIWRWNELVPEWKSLGYHVPWLAGLVKRMTVSASGDGLSASSFSSSSSPPSASVFWKCESNIIHFLLLHVGLLWKAGRWNSPQFFSPSTVIPGQMFNSEH